MRTDWELALDHAGDHVLAGVGRFDFFPTNRINSTQIRRNFIKTQVL